MLGHTSNTSKIIESLKNILLYENNKDIGLGIKIEGKWGIGKTHFWHNFKNSYLKNKDVVYISLFGLDSIENVKETIITKLVNYNKSYFKKLIKKTENLKIYGVGVGGILSLYSDNEFEKIIICFDDFERLSNKINLKDVLGLISQLKEQKKCKIVMILNEEELNKLESIEKEKYSEIFSLYEEKIVDYAFPFKPSFDEQFKIIETDINEYFNRTWSAWIKSYFHEIKIDNIRKMKYILRQLKHFTFVEDEGYVVGKETFWYTGISHGTEKHENLKGTKLDEKVIKEFVEIALSVFAEVQIDFSDYGVDSKKELMNVIVDFKKTYQIDKNKIFSFLSYNNAHIYRYEIREKILQNIKDIELNFQVNTEKILEDTAKLINKHSNELEHILSYYTFKFLVKLFNCFSITIPTEKIIIEQYIKQLHNLRFDFSHDDTETLDEIFSNYNWAENYFDSLNKTQSKGIDDTTIIEILNTHCYEWEWQYVNEYLQLNSVPLEDFKKLILTSPKFVDAFIFYKSREYVKEDQCEPPRELEIGIKRIEEALDTIEVQNKYDQFKIDKIKKL